MCTHGSLEWVALSWLELSVAVTVASVHTGLPLWGLVAARGVANVQDSKPAFWSASANTADPVQPWA